MLRMQVMHQPKKWEEYLPLVYISYKNGYHKSMKMSPFEALYGRKFHVTINWDNPLDKIKLGLDMLKDMEKQVAQTKQNLKVAQDKEKIYANINRDPRDFKVGDHVYL